jgi:phosphate transport system substrate-binding protein
MKPILASWGSIALLALAAGCGPGAGSIDEATERLDAAAGSEGKFAGKLELTGSSTIAPLALEIGKRFTALHPDVRVDVQTGGSSRGVADALGGLADIGMASRALKPEEIDQGLVAHPIAQDGICLIVHKDNPVASLTNDRIVAIFTGRIENWNEVGGSDAPIIVVNKAEGRSTLELFVAYFGLEGDHIDADIIIGDNQQGVKSVAGNPGAIGYVSIGTAEYDAGVGVAIKLLPLDGIEPSTENVRSGSFPISRPLNFVTRSEPAGLAKEFILFAQSSEVTDLLKELSYVPLAP